ncbi:hypothetical protein AB0A74_40570 [Saccharothrix sp. NPDC042600]|uniref:hypothetical protein n=1 Tax=Saccharothrix sp. NPDC042600 TaxID=3154492 RepID=UPI0033CA3D77
MAVDTLLWVLQGVMAFLTVPSGLMTALRPAAREYLHGEAVRLGGPSPVERLGGLLVAACGVALLVPGLVGRATVLTPVAALALLVPAVVVPTLKVRRGDIGPGFWLFGVLYLAAAPVLVAWGRLGPYPL